MARETRRPASENAGFAIEGLAEFALATLAASSMGREAAYSSSEVKDLCKALTQPSDATYQQIFLKTIADGGTSDELIDRTIPSLARQLGDDWSSDNLSFADVTIGISRLQQTVRLHGARKEVDGLKPPSGQRVLLVLPQNEQHSLGTFILANQMRRRGILVQLALDCTSDHLSSLVEDQNYAMVGLSIGTQQSLDNVHKFASSARVTGTTAKIVLGGAALAEFSAVSASDFDADYIAKDDREALDFCQIDTAPTTSLPPEYVEP